MLCICVYFFMYAYKGFKCIFKSGQLFSEHEVKWSKCKSVSTDGAWAMVGVCSEVVALIKHVAPEVVSIHCILHREALVAKKLANEEKTVNLPMRFVASLKL